jgi:integrase
LCDGYGLYLQVAKGGSKTWVFRYRVNGKLREMGLGSIHTLSLAEARERARECRKLRLERKDPIEERRAQHQATALAAAKAMSFRQCAEAYISAHKAGWRNPKHASQWPTTLAAYVYPVFGDPPVQAVDTGLVMKAIEPIWNEKPETASRVRGRIESVLDWAAARGYRRGENPARWRGHLDQLLPAPSKAKRAKRRATGRSEHHPAMPYDEIAAFMKELAGRHGNAARALEFTILTAKRTEEVIGARHREFNLTEAVWTIPAGRMKGEREHRVSLSAAAVAVLAQMEVDRQRRPDVFVFPGAKSGHGLSNMAMLKLLQKGMNRPDYTVHGFRSTFRDWGAECTSFPNEVLEMALAHVVDDKVEAAYRRGDLFAKRRQLADAWARYCAESARAGDDNFLAIGHHTHSAELA